MKNSLIVLLLILMLCTVALVACDDTEYAIIFNTDGGSEIESVSLENLDILIEPEYPTKEGYYFDGWYTDSQCTVAFDWDVLPTEPTEIFVKWGEAVGDLYTLFKDNKDNVYDYLSYMIAGVSGDLDNADTIATSGEYDNLYDMACYSGYMLEDSSISTQVKSYEELFGRDVVSCISLGGSIIAVEFDGNIAMNNDVAIGLSDWHLIQSYGNVVLEEALIPYDILHGEEFVYDESGIYSSDGKTLYNAFCSDSVYEIAEGVETISQGAFYMLISLTHNAMSQIILPDSIININRSAFVMYEDTQINIPTSVQHIGEYAFFGCENVSIDGDLTKLQYIGDYAFFYTNLEEMYLCENVSHIGVGAFFVGALQINLEVDDNNQYYAIYDGGLYTLDKTVLLMWLSDGGIAYLEDELVYISDFAFTYSNVSGIVMGSNVLYIGCSAMYGISNMNSIVIPSSVMYMGEYALWGTTCSIKCEFASQPVGGWSDSWTNNEDVVWLYAVDEELS